MADALYNMVLPPHTHAPTHPRTRLPRLWLCVAHQHRQCSTCAAVGRGVRHCRARRHAGHPPLPTTSPGPLGRVRAAGLRTPGRGGTPSAKRPKRPQPLAAGGTWAYKRGRAHPDPLPPPPRQADMCEAARSCQARTCWHRGYINPTPPEVLAQARPSDATPVGARQDSRQVPARWPEF